MRSGTGMTYKSLPAVFLYQTIVGALCIVNVSLFGPAGIATLAILGLRPLLLEKKKGLPDQSRWQFYYKIMKISVVCTAITIIFVYLILELFSQSIPVRRLWLLMVPPYFVFIHGFIGLVFSLKSE